MKQYFVGVDLGSANVVMVVGSREEGEELINIEGISVQQSKKSIKQGHICTTLKSAVQNLGSVIQSAKEELEQELGIKIEQGYFGQGDVNTRCVIVEDMIPVKNKRTGVIGNDDLNIIRHLIGQIPTESCAEGVWEFSPLCYFVNGTKQTLDPTGLQGSWLKARYQLTIGLNNQQNYLKGLHHKLGMEIQNIFVTPTITYPLLVSEKEAEQGVVIVDLGAEVTDVTIVRDNRVQYFRSLPLGADLIDADLKSILPAQSNVTKIKHLYGKAMSSEVADNEVIKDGAKDIIHRNIATVIEARLMDIAEIVSKVVAESGFEQFIPHGYVLTGGSSSIAMIDALFERELNRPCRKADKLYGIGNKPQDCEITPGQHAAVAVMLQAAKFSSSYVRELDVVESKTETEQDVEPVIPKPKVVVPKVTTPVVATEEKSAEDDVTPKVTPKDNTPVEPTPADGVKRGKSNGMFGKVARFFSRTLGDDNKDK